LSKLADVPTPAGPTQRQIGAELVQITSIRPAIPGPVASHSGKVLFSLRLVTKLFIGLSEQAKSMTAF
jgi:hypothetical protein